MDLDWGPDEGSASGGLMAESPILFLHRWGMKDVSISKDITVTVLFRSYHILPSWSAMVFMT